MPKRHEERRCSGDVFYSLESGRIATIVLIGHIKHVMNKHYFRFRMFLMAFVLGLAGFWFIDGSFNGLLEPRMDLPKTEIGAVLVVFPRYNCEIPLGGGGHGYSDDELTEHHDCGIGIKSKRIMR